jgi:hypothetical protein
MLSAIVQAAGAADRICPIPTCDPRLIGYRTANAKSVEEHIRLDGRLDEPAWAAAERIAGFIQGRPTPGAASRLRTEASVVVGADALYVAVWLFDPSPQGIVAPYLRRDNEDQSDWVFVEIDSRADRRTAFSFGLNPRGVQVDGVFVDDVNYDVEWNGVWEGAARIGAAGWTAEYRIPFSQLAFANGRAGDPAVWGFNVYRYSPHYGESSNWSPRFQGLPGCVSQFNHLRLNLPGAVGRIDLMPFIAPRIESGGGDRAASMNGGADLTVGLGSSFALTATLLPDFGQVEADPSQINLTTFELFQSERRPFFVEGAGAFSFPTGLTFTARDNSFADETAFYSRRVGRDGARIAGALKLTGRTAGGWSVGLFGAATEAVRSGSTGGPAAILDPAGSTTMLRAVRSLRGGESAVGVIAGIVEHHGDGAEHAVSTAALYGVDARHRFLGGAYELGGWALGSRVTGSHDVLSALADDPRHGFDRPDAGPDGPRRVGDRLEGSAVQAHVSKVGGAWLWNLAGETISPAFETNDIGFQRNADWRIVKADWRYQHQASKGPVRQWTFGSDDLGAGWSTSGLPRAREADALVRADFRSYWDATISWRRDLPAFSTEWLRGGPALWMPARDTWHVIVDSDTRRLTTMTLDASAWRERGSGSSAVTISPLVSGRVAGRVGWSVGPSYSDQTIGWYLPAAPSAEPIVVRRLRQQTASFITRADLVFDRTALLQIYLQPFVSTGRLDRPLQLIASRATRPEQQFAPLSGSLSGDGSTEQSLNATVVFRWEYRPASFFTLAWNWRQDAELPGRGSLTDAVRGFGVGNGESVLVAKTSVRLGR